MSVQSAAGGTIGAMIVGEAAAAGRARILHWACSGTEGVACIGHRVEVLSVEEQVHSGAAGIAINCAADLAEQWAPRWGRRTALEHMCARTLRTLVVNVSGCLLFVHSPYRLKQRCMLYRFVI